MKFLEEEQKFKFTTYLNKDAVILTMLSFVLISTIFNAFFKGSSYITISEEARTPPLTNFCALLGDQLIARKVNSKMFADNIFQVLIAANYKILEFNGKESLLGSTSSKENCLTYIRDDLGVRVFSFTVSESNQNPAYYQVTGLKEI